MKINILIVIIIILLITSNVSAGDYKLSGLVFGDLFWNAAYHDSALKNQNGMRFRRIYFTYDNTLSKAFFIRLRLEARSTSDYSTKSSITPFIKDAYVRWNLGKHSILLGISPSPTFEFIDKIWGYRTLEKSPVDLQNLGPSRDSGIAVKGSFYPQNRVQYHFMIGNGNGAKSEDNKGKKAMGALTVNLCKNIYLQGYGDWNVLPDEQYRYTSQFFIAYKNQSFRAAAQFVQQTWKEEGSNNSQAIRMGSVFTAAKICKKLWGYARVDRTFDPNPLSAKIGYIPFANARSTFILAGLDILLDKNVHIMPNFEFIKYCGDEASTPDSDLIPRLTFFYTWQ